MMAILGIDTPYYVRHRYRPWQDKQGHHHVQHEVTFMRDPAEQAPMTTTSRERREAVAR